MIDAGGTIPICNSPPIRRCPAVLPMCNHATRSACPPHTSECYNNFLYFLLHAACKQLPSAGSGIGSYTENLFTMGYESKTGSGNNRHISPFPL